MLTKHQRVTITGAAGTCEGEVLHIETPGTLPPISGAPEVARVRGILEERGIKQIALIGHKHAGKPVQFMALQDAAGDWRDLKGQALAIVPGGIQ
jgi:hypothetical protein